MEVRGPGVAAYAPASLSSGLAAIAGGGGVHRGGVDDAGQDLGTAPGGVDLERGDVVLQRAAAAHAALEVAGNTGAVVEDRPQAVALGQRVVRGLSGEWNPRALLGVLTVQVQSL